MDLVLLIEGHALLRNALRDLITQNGFRSVVEVAEPSEAINQAIRLSPQIIILDSSWIEISGKLLGRILRQIAPKSKIILLVDESWLTDQETAGSAGADVFIPKNGLTKALSSVLAEWRLNSKERLRENPLGL